MLDAQRAASSAELETIEARAVIGEHAAGVDTEASEPVGSTMQEVDRGDGFLVGVHGGEGKPGVIVDGDVEELPSSAAGLVAGIAGDAMPSPDDAGELLDVEVHQITGHRMLIANHRLGWLQHPDPVQLQPSQDAADGGTTQTGDLGDLHPGPTLAAHRLYSGHQLRRGGPPQPPRP